MNKNVCPAGRFKIAAVLLLLLSCFSVRAQSVSYYVDTQNGSDGYAGRSIAKPWKTLNKLNTVIFKPGDHIFLKRGQLFKGSLQLKGQGTVSQRIKLAAYGTGRRPVISSAGHNYSVQLMDTQNWQVEDIETKGSSMAGIYFGCTKDSLSMQHFGIKNCYVHNIGDTSKLSWDLCTTTGGIIVANSCLRKDGKLNTFVHSVFNDVVISNCIVRYNYRWTCFSITSGSLNGIRGNVNFIKNCIAEYSSADGIRMNGVQNSFIEYCTMYRNGAWPNFAGKNLGGLGAWFFNSENCTIQYCEAGYVRTATTDGGAFDIDYLQKNSTVQYCYGHDCAGYGVSVFGADHTFPTENSTVRYNVFSNNGQDPAFAYESDFFVYTWGGGLLNGVKIYDNTSYWSPAADSVAVRVEADFTGSNPNLFSNNTVFSKRAKLMYLKNDTMRSDNNNYRTPAHVEPQWQFKKKNFRSFTEWQQKTGMEAHSRVNDIIANDGASQSIFNDRSGLFNFQGIKMKPGNLTLVSFVDPNDQETNQAQLVFIKSMENQYAGYGLNIILVDECNLGKNSRRDTGLANFISDRELKNIMLVRDDAKHSMTKKFGIKNSPATFLLAKNGRQIQRWDTLAQPAELAKSIERELGDKLSTRHFEY